MNKLICDMCEKDITYHKENEKVKAVFKNKDNDDIKKDLCEECFEKVYEVIETNSQKELYQTLLKEQEREKQGLIGQLEKDIKAVNCGEILSIRSVLKNYLEIVKGEKE